ncbi:unnamed protein product [Euphydryas editha]|uniref:TIL domain-containing protein n=1 Tax=Euphydryas editha TaxID=104508 RepID=A0AAU9U9R4_EUPED|nr:unnamed protein product [Euphydryas editha]
MIFMKTVVTMSKKLLMLRDEECEAGTYSYTTGCDVKTPEPTCADPNPKPEEGIICDYTACYCNPPTVRHPVSNKCVPLEECPK